ncbi:MAG: hypothetical protein QXE81_03060 [Desulfurococcaceae archaeon]
MLRYTRDNSRIHIELSWRKLELDVYLYLCKAKTTSLLEEIEYRKFNSKNPITLIPVNLVENMVQLLQGSLYYKIYAQRVHRVRNQGLLLASFILGVRQLNDLLDILEKSFVNTDKYYIVGVDTPLVDTSECVNPGLGEGGTMNIAMLVKNTGFAISVT